MLEYPPQNSYHGSLMQYANVEKLPENVTSRFILKVRKFEDESGRGRNTPLPPQRKAKTFNASILSYVKGIFSNLEASAWKQRSIARSNVGNDFEYR